MGKEKGEQPAGLAWKRTETQNLLVFHVHMNNSSQTTEPSFSVLPRCILTGSWLRSSIARSQTKESDAECRSPKKWAKYCLTTPTPSVRAQFLYLLQSDRSEMNIYNGNFKKEYSFWCRWLMARLQPRCAFEIITQKWLKPSVDLWRQSHLTFSGSHLPWCYSFQHPPHLSVIKQGDDEGIGGSHFLCHSMSV